MSMNRLIKLIDQQARTQENLQDDYSLEESNLPNGARSQRRALDHKGDLHNTFATELREISGDAESAEGIVGKLNELSEDFRARALSPYFDKDEGEVEVKMLVGFRATIAGIIAQGSFADQESTLSAQLRFELESLNESQAIDVLNILKDRHGWAGSLVTGHEIREELEMLLPEVTEGRIAEVKATPQ